MHGSLVWQKLWPVSFWYVPLAHGLHVAALLVLEKRPVSHLLHTRSWVLLPALDTCSPAAHGVCVAQNVCDALAWYCPSAHGVQLTAFTVLEKYPAAQL